MAGVVCIHKSSCKPREFLLLVYIARFVVSKRYEIYSYESTHRLFVLHFTTSISSSGGSDLTISNCTRSNLYYCEGKPLDPKTEHPKYRYCVLLLHEEQTSGPVNINTQHETLQCNVLCSDGSMKMENGWYWGNSTQVPLGLFALISCYSFILNCNLFSLSRSLLLPFWPSDRSSTVPWALLGTRIQFHIICFISLLLLISTDHSYTKTWAC